MAQRTASAARPALHTGQNIVAFRVTEKLFEKALADVIMRLDGLVDHRSSPKKRTTRRGHTMAAKEESLAATAPATVPAEELRTRASYRRRHAPFRVAYSRNPGLTTEARILGTTACTTVGPICKHH